jgi:hypothetical protein
MLEALRAVLPEPVKTELWQRVAEELLELASPGALGGDPGVAGVLPLAIESAWLTAVEPPGPRELLEMVESWVARPDAPRLLGLNRYDGEDWVRREELETLLRWRGACGLCGWLLMEAVEERAERALAWIESTELLMRVFSDSGFAVGQARKRLLRRPGRAGGAGAAGATSKGARARRRRKRRPSRPR